MFKLGSDNLRFYAMASNPDKPVNPIPLEEPTYKPDEFQPIPGDIDYPSQTPEEVPDPTPRQG
jgi:hypothetical protein